MIATFPSSRPTIPPRHSPSAFPPRPSPLSHSPWAVPPEPVSGVRYRSFRKRSPGGGAAVLLEGKTAVVSGVGPGLGRAICDALHREGAHLVVGDIDEAALKSVVEDLGATGQVCDITDADACAALADLAATTHGRIDVLVND